MQNKNKVHPAAFVCGIAVVLILLQAGGLMKGNKVVFPGLPEIWQAFVRLLGDGKTYAKIGTTMLHVLEALAVSAVIGIAAGLAEGISGWIHSFFKPLMILIRSMPMIVLVILIMSLISYRSVPVVAAGMVLIPMFSEAACEGCRSLDPELIDVYRMNGGLSVRVFRYVYIPMISAFLKQAFVNAAGMGIKVVVSAEYLVQTRDSLGKAVYSSSYFSDYAEVYAYAFIMILLVLLLTELPERILCAGGRNKNGGKALFTCLSRPPASQKEDNTTVPGHGMHEKNRK